MFVALLLSTVVPCVVQSMANPITLECGIANTSAPCRLSKNKEKLECVNTIWDVPKKDWPKQWRYQPKHINETVFMVYENGHSSLLSCDDMWARNIKESCEDDDYCRPAINSLIPNGCYGRSINPY